MGVKLSKLKRTGVRKIIRFTDENNNIQEIKIFEPDEELTEKLSEVVLQHSEINNKEMKVNLPQNVVITEFLKVLTDIELPDSQEEIDEVIENPNIPFQKVLTEIISLVTELTEVNINTLKTINKMNEVKENSGIQDSNVIDLLEVKQDLEKAKEEAVEMGAKIEEIKNQSALNDKIEEEKDNRTKCKAEERVAKSTIKKDKVTQTSEG